MNIHCLSYNYSKSSTEIKKYLVLSDLSEQKEFYQKLVLYSGIKDFLVLNTCNRLEVYYLAEESINEQIKDLLFGDDLVSKSGIFALELKGRSALKHLFEVSIGAKSQVLGDNQVIFQLKEAYKIANDFTELSGLFHQLMHVVFRLNKRVVNETSFKEGSVSIASSAVQLLGNLVKKHKETPILLVGTGQNGRDTVKNLLNSGYSNIFVCNRTDEKAMDMSNEFGLGFLSFAELSSKIDRFKAVILSVHSQEYLINREFFDWQKLRYEFTYFLDLGVLPSIDPKIEQNPCFEIYDLSYMTDRNEESLVNRQLALQAVSKIIEEECSAFEKSFVIKSLFDEFYKLGAGLNAVEACEYLDEFLAKNLTLDFSSEEKESIKARFFTILEKSDK